MKKTRLPTENRKLSLFKGDWEDLESILSPRHVKPTEFIRELVHKTIQQINSKRALHERSTTIEYSIDLEDLQ